MVPYLSQLHRYHVCRCVEDGVPIKRCIEKCNLNFVPGNTIYMQIVPIRLPSVGNTYQFIRYILLNIFFPSSYVTDTTLHCFERMFYWVTTFRSEDGLVDECKVKSVGFMTIILLCHGWRLKCYFGSNVDLQRTFKPFNSEDVSDAVCQSDENWCLPGEFICSWSHSKCVYMSRNVLYIFLNILLL